VVKPAQTQQIDSIDKGLLNEIQWVFPLSNRPFYAIANQHNISEEEVMNRISPVLIG